MLRPRCTSLVADPALGGIHGKKELLQHRRWKGSTYLMAAGDSQAQGPPFPPPLPFSKSQQVMIWSRGAGDGLCPQLGDTRLQPGSGLSV